MSRPRRAAQPRRQPRLFDVNRAIIKIHFARSKKQVHSSVLAKFLVRRFRPRIFLKIRSRLELQRIDEDADCHFPIISRVLARHPNQLQMSTMQRTHRRYEHGLAYSLTHMRMGRIRRLDNLHLENSPSRTKPPVPLESIQIAWRPTANFRCPKFFQLARSASFRISKKLKARAADSRASVFVISSRYIVAVTKYTAQLNQRARRKSASKTRALESSRIFCRARTASSVVKW